MEIPVEGHQDSQEAGDVYDIHRQAMGVGFIQTARKKATGQTEDFHSLIWVKE